MEPSVQKKLADFFSGYRPLNFKKGEILIRPADSITDIYFLKKGFVKQYTTSEDGDEVSIHIFKPTSFFPIMLALSDAENSYFFEAMNHVEVVKAPKGETLEFIKEEPEILFDLCRRFAAGLNGLAKRIDALMFESAYKRVSSLLLYLGKRFGEKKRGGILIQLTLPHKDIASWVNLTRETTSRQLEKLAKMGIITYKNRLILIKDIKMLENQTA